MSKADSSPSTAASAPKSRRAVILGAGGAAAAGAILALPSAAGATTARQSPEFLEYLRRKAEWNACFVEPYEEDEAWHALVGERGDTVEALVEIILERQPRSWQDVVELATVVREELWDYDTEDGECLHPHSDHGDLEPALMNAIFAVAAKGGANV